MARKLNTNIVQSSSATVHKPMKVTAHYGQENKMLSVQDNRPCIKTKIKFGMFIYMYITIQAKPDLSWTSSNNPGI